MTISTESYQDSAISGPGFLGKYEIRRILGRGAMGTVYEAFDPVIERRVAIKTVTLPGLGDIEADDLARFRREAQAAGRLSHPDIVGVYDYGETDRMAYIVMEFVEGVTLKPTLDKGERFALPEIRRIMLGLLAGLAYSHENGVIHRDIKPANVMLAPDGKVKLTDFGVARIESSNLTQEGTMIGTPSYMSPEQFTGHPADARSDIYSAGVLLYQLLTGEKPFEGGITAIMHKVLHVEPPAPSVLNPALPRGLDPVVLRAMAKRPEARYASAAEFAAALAEAIPDGLAGSPEPLPGPGAAPPGATTRTARVWVVGSIAAAAVLAGTIGVALRHGDGVTGSAHPLVFSLNGISLRLARAVRPVSCTLLQGEVTPQAANLAGLAGTAAMPALRAALLAVPVPVHLAVSRFSGPYCPVLDAVHGAAPLFAPPAERLSLGLVNGATSLSEGQFIMPQLRLPDYPSNVEVDYFTHDGAVLHLYPTPSDPPSVQPAASLLVLGNPATSRGWAAGPPFGTDMILAIASAKPLFDADRLQAEPAEDYLAALHAALGRVKGRVAVSALLLTTTAAGLGATETPSPPLPQTVPAAPAR